MKLGEVYKIEIIDMGMEGEGIGKVDGMAVFVEGAIVGDLAEVEITQVKKSFARGKVLSLIQKSEHRILPQCSYAEECGGCTFQSMDYEGQLSLKQKWVSDRLQRIGGVTDVEVKPTLGMNEPYRYRNKAQFPIQAGRLVKNHEGKLRNNKPCSIGFYKPKTHDVVHCEHCMIQAEPAEALAAAVKKYVEEQTVSVYDPKNGMGLLRHLIVKSAFATGEVMAILVVNGSHLKKEERLIELMDEAINALPLNESGEPRWYLESVVLNINKNKGSQILGKECVTLAGKPTITDQVGDLVFEISPKSFYQVNPVQMKVLYDKVVEFAALTGEETVLDLYCGVGTIGLYCASKAKRIIGIESEKAAVIDANRNAVINGIVNAEYICGKSEEVLPKRLKDVKADVVILDPPRVGCHAELLEAVLKVDPKRIVYVSCDPATLARDIKVLGEGGYSVKEVQPVDMFPSTGHVETIIMMTKCGSEGKK
ncbi:23S rRNA (uracil(1939)-C(5))-methyltransferase RlmD [Anaerovorax sp. IOR16]|uniref:23S rRNA (uracil(1939)-C(5))-methyltransferase RlmD n=1 Tax=Anaerovorax sp. IOR16 TaxID=2773458 RepID=UPI0019D1A406|nr:23S rRNA (uracil(1939)-C(5))-methyltransferase RlmD [Anaerovorax sp. IOR16]